MKNIPRIVRKSVYADKHPDDGFRILVDRLWPRGIARREEKWDYWAKEMAPSTELRRWFAHVPARWEGFRKSYWQELDENPQGESFLSRFQKEETITLVFAARELQYNHARVLESWLISRWGDHAFREPGQ